MGLVVMPIKPVAKKKASAHSMQLSASEVQAFLDANLDSVSPNWTARFTRIMQRPVGIPHLCLPLAWSLWLACCSALNNPITFVGEMVSTPLKPAQHTNQTSSGIK